MHFFEESYICFFGFFKAFDYKTKELLKIYFSTHSSYKLPSLELYFDKGSKNLGKLSSLIVCVDLIIHEKRHLNEYSFCCISASYPEICTVNVKSSRLQRFFKIGVLKKFLKIHRKTSLLITLSAILSKKCFWHMCFPVNLEKFLRTIF